jgi:hypothetical protein
MVEQNFDAITRRGKQLRIRGQLCLQLDVIVCPDPKCQAMRLCEQKRLNGSRLFLAEQSPGGVPEKVYSAGACVAALRSW